MQLMIIPPYSPIRQATRMQRWKTVYRHLLHAPAIDHDGGGRESLKMMTRNFPEEVPNDDASPMTRKNKSMNHRHLNNEVNPRNQIKPKRQKTMTIPWRITVKMIRPPIINIKAALHPSLNLPLAHRRITINDPMGVNAIDPPDPIESSIPRSRPHPLSVAQMNPFDRPALESHRHGVD